MDITKIMYTSGHYIKNKLTVILVYMLYVSSLHSNLVLYHHYQYPSRLSNLHHFYIIFTTSRRQILKDIPI